MEKRNLIFPVTITARITAEQKTKIEKLAKEHAVSKSEYVRTLFEKHHERI